MPKLPTVADLGARPEPRPSTGVVSYQAVSGHETAPGLAMAADAAQLEQFAKAEQEKQDTVKVEDAWNQYKNTATDMTAGQNGVLRMKGSDAVNSNMLQTVEGNLKDARTKMMENLQTDEQRARFKARADTTDLGVKHQVLNHLVTEQAAYDDTTMAGTVAAARTQVTSTPTDRAVFMQAEATVMAQADAYLDRKGIRDAGARADYKAKINDSLWVARIDSLLYQQPVLADAMFRANEKEIKNPELRLTLQNKTREIALGVVATNDADRFIAETRQAAPRVALKSFEGDRDAQLTQINNTIESRRKKGLPEDPDLIEAKYVVENNITAEPNTSGLPNSKDIAAQLPLALARVQATATDRYGADRNNPDRAAYVHKAEQAVKAKIADEVAQITAVQKQAFDGITDFILGPVQGGGTGAAPGAGGAMTVATGTPQGGGLQRVTAFSQIQANPEMMRRYQMLTADQKRAVDTQLRVNANHDERGDPALYNELRNRINLPPDDPNKINWWQTLNNDPRVQRGNLNIAQMNSLRGELDRASTDDGRTQAASKKAGENLVKQMFAGDWTLTMGGTQKGNADYALELWSRNADKVVGLYKQQNKDIRPLFDPTPGNKESLVTPQAIAAFKVQAGGAATSGEALSAAAKTKVGEAATTPPAQMPATVKDEASLQAWFKTLPANVDRFVGSDGKTRLIPNRTPAVSAQQDAGNAPVAAPAAIPGQVTLADIERQRAGSGATESFGLRRDGTPKGNGFLGVLQRPDGNKSTELTVGVNVNGQDMDVPTLVPTLTRPEVDHLLTMKDGPPPPRGTDKVFDGIVDKAVTHAKQRLADGKSVFATPEEAAKAVPPAAAAAADDIPTLVEGPTAPKGSRSEEQKIATAARLEEILKTGLRIGRDGVLDFVATPLRAVQRVYGTFMQAVNALSRTDEERAVTGFRQVLKQGTFRANEDTVVMLNNFLASKKGTEAENVKATKMLKVIADKLGIEPTPADGEPAAKDKPWGVNPRDGMDARSQAKYKEATGDDINGTGAVKASQEGAPAGYKAGSDSKVGKGTSAQDEAAIKMFMSRGLTRAQAEAEVARTRR